MIRILFLTANPLGDENGEPPLKLYREFESIDDKIQLEVKHIRVDTCTNANL